DQCKMSPGCLTSEPCRRGPMPRFPVRPVPVLLIAVTLAPGAAVGADAPAAGPIRGVLLDVGRATPGALAAWRADGGTGGGLPGRWSGVFLNDLQAGPSSCGCGNDQCRWALDYGAPATAPKTPGDDAAARAVAEVRTRFPDKAVIPVWVTECETVDLPGVP